MLLKNFYTLDSISHEPNTLRCTITINKDHDIYKGHFPGNPVTPGVCMMQIIKELLEKALDSKLLMQSVTRAKFTAIINPEIDPVVDLIIAYSENEDGIKVKNTSTFNQTTALKLNALFTRKTEGDEINPPNNSIC